MKDYDKNKESSYIQYWDVNNLYGWAMLQKLPVNNFEWIKDTSQFNEDFIKNYNEESDEGYFLEVDVQYLEKLHELHNNLLLLPEPDFEKDFFKLMNNAVFGKTMENVRKHRDIKLVTTERRRNYLVSEPNYHTITFVTENLLAMEI